MLGIMKKLLLICLLILACKDEPRMAPLYTDLDTSAMADITSYLQENKYKYKLEKNDSTILVPIDKLYKIRMDLAETELPKDNGKAYKFFDKERLDCGLHNPSMTDSALTAARNSNHRRAIESELARSVEAIVKTASGVDISEVEKARVSINKDTTALVMIQLHPYRGLNEKQIKGIQHLVAIAVDELKAEQVRVCIIDHKGNALTEYCPERKVIRSCGSSCGD